jgi:hypothetical protein
VYQIRIIESLENNKIKVMKNNSKKSSGMNALWDGPLSTKGFPMGKGSSSGADGMQVSKYPTAYKAGPITQTAK